MDWTTAWNALGDLDGDDWDRESERLDALWRAYYQSAFVAFALSRPGWTPENAEVWAGEIVDEALIELGGDPVQAARTDVLRCEQETASL